MTDEIMPREDRMGKILSFIGGCIAGIAGVFTVAVMSEMSQKEEDVSLNNTKSNCKEDDSVM